MPEETKCPLCRKDAKKDADGPYAKVECERCGTYRIADDAAAALGGDDEARKTLFPHILSGLTREAHEDDRMLTLSNDGSDSSLDVLLKSPGIPEDPFDQMDRLVLNVRKYTTQSGMGLGYDSLRDCPVIFGRDAVEFDFILKQCKNRGWIEGEHMSSFKVVLVLTPDGWQRAKELTHVAAKKDQAFIAMWYNDVMSDPYEKGIAPALTDAGFVPLCLKFTDHNEKIDDLIVKSIRESGLVIADCTGQRESVYFEGGFASGLGLPVIWLCRDDEFDKCSFDTRQYSYIVWKTPEDLRERLFNRIGALGLARR